MLKPASTTLPDGAAPEPSPKETPRFPLLSLEEMDAIEARHLDELIARRRAERQTKARSPDP